MCTSSAPISSRQLKFLSYVTDSIVEGYDISLGHVQRSLGNNGLQLTRTTNGEICRAIKNIINVHNMHRLKQETKLLPYSMQQFIQSNRKGVAALQVDNRGRMCRAFLCLGNSVIYNQKHWLPVLQIYGTSMKHVAYNGDGIVLIGRHRDQ